MGITYKDKVTTKTVLTATLYKGEQPTTLPVGAAIAYQWCKKADDKWVDIEGATEAIYPDVEMTDRATYCCKAVLTKGGE